MMSPSLILNPEILGWARTAHYVASTAGEGGDVELNSEAGAPARYFIRRRGPDRLELTQLADGDDESPVLFVARVEVLGHYLIGLFADDIREDLDLPYLDLPWAPGDLAPGYSLTDMARGYRTLRRAGQGPIAAAPDPTLSLVSLVPLSHLLGWSIADLKQSMLDAEGAPFLDQGRYARP